MVNRSARLFGQNLVGTERFGLLVSKISPLIVHPGPHNRSIEDVKWPMLLSFLNLMMGFGVRLRGFSQVA